MGYNHNAPPNNRNRNTREYIIRYIDKRQISYRERFTKVIISISATPLILMSERFCALFLHNINIHINQINATQLQIIQSNSADYSHHDNHMLVISGLGSETIDNTMTF